MLVIHKTHNYNFVDETEKTNLKDITLRKVEQILTSTSQAIDEVKQMERRVQNRNDESIAKLDQAFEDMSQLCKAENRFFWRKFNKFLQKI